MNAERVGVIRPCFYLLEEHPSAFVNDASHGPDWPPWRPQYPIAHDYHYTEWSLEPVNRVAPAQFLQTVFVVTRRTASAAMPATPGRVNPVRTVVRSVALATMAIAIVAVSVPGVATGLSPAARPTG